MRGAVTEGSETTAHSDRVERCRSFAQQGRKIVTGTQKLIIVAAIAAVVVWGGYFWLWG